ncbi:MAG: RDD family protein, partial [Nitrospiria bacterium]
MTDARSPRGGFFRRAGAAVIDLLLVSALYLGFLALGLVAIRLGVRSAGASGPSMELANILWVPYLALWAAITELYIAYWTHTGGQTPGKMALGIRVIGADDGDPTWAQACLRPVPYLLSWSVFGL